MELFDILYIMNKPNVIKIKPIGSYFEVDKHGYIINPTSQKKIQTQWRSVVDEVLNVYKRIYKTNLLNVYIRGSVAKGQAVENISDIDTFAYVDLQKDKIDATWRNKEEKIIIENYPFVGGVEFGVSPIDSAINDQIILNQSFCIYGEPVDVSNLKIDKNLAIHAPSFVSRIKRFNTFYQQDKTSEEIMGHCVWQMKGIIRTGAELVIERSGKYTRDLYRCYEVFSEYYPEKEDEMRVALELALNPTEDKKKIKEVMDGIGAWLLSESGKYFLE